MRTTFHFAKVYQLHAETRYEEGDYSGELDPWCIKFYERKPNPEEPEGIDNGGFHIGMGYQFSVDYMGKHLPVRKMLKKLYGSPLSKPKPSGYVAIDETLFELPFPLRVEFDAVPGDRGYVIVNLAFSSEKELG